MKNIVSLFLVIFLFSMNSFSQDFDIQLVANTLQKENFISEEEKLKLVDVRNPFSVGQAKASFLYSLGNIFLKRYLPDNLKAMNVP